MTRNEFDLLVNIKSGRKFTECADLDNLKAQKLVDESGVTAKGEAALEPYKVDNAVIMSAGMSTRFVPLSLEKPKGLLRVKGEILIERQIEQLLAAGISNIVLVLGYKKEQFLYLEKKYGVKIVVNPLFNFKNNIETLRVTKNFLGNTYICSSDDYFSENPFEKYVWRSYYASIHVTEETDEDYVIPNEDFCIKKVVKKTEAGRGDGFIMLGHVYWSAEFSKAFSDLIERHAKIGDYDEQLWEYLFADNIDKLPPMEIREFKDGTIFEFDSLAELREFDETYVNDTGSKIMRNICAVMKCEERDVKGLRLIKGGLTNTSFAFNVNGETFVYRHPGDGTEKIISRQHEKKSLEIAKSIGADTTFIFMDENEGWKISRFVADFRRPEYDNFEDSRRVVKFMRNLHEKNLSVDWEFSPWDEACKIERILREGGEIAADGFDELKANVQKCFEATKGDGVKKRFCHCDTYAPNWMFSGGETILIDWEYAGNADPGCDVGYYIADGMFEIDESEKFIAEYCGENYSETLRLHYLAYTAIIAYYWFVWALYREQCGFDMGKSLENWRKTAKKYADFCVNELRAPTTQHNTTQHNTTQHNTTQHNTTQLT